MTSSPTRFTTRSILSTSTRIVVAAGLGGGARVAEGSAATAGAGIGPAGGTIDGEATATGSGSGPAADSAAAATGMGTGSTVTSVISMSQSPVTNSNTSSIFGRSASVSSVPVQPI